MNKKILIVALCLTCIMLIYGCDVSGANTEVVSPNVESPSSSAVNSKQSERVDVNYDAVGFELLVKESSFVLNNSLLDTDVIKLLGEPEKKSETVVWEADGLEHQEWYYNSKGIELGFARDEKDNLVVFSINLQNPCTIKTSRGVGVGSARSEVLKAYEHEINPEEDNIGSESIVAGTVYGGLVFIFENDKVSSIFIGAAAE